MSKKRQQPASLTLLTRAQVLRRVPVSYTTLWQWMRAGTFPRSVVIGPNTVGWYAHEIDEFCRTRPRRELKAPNTPKRHHGPRRIRDGPLANQASPGE